jgi:alanyl-tRNA synthetase
MKTVKDMRAEFLGYFAKQGHEIVESSSLVPHNDPTLMFTNSGMVQFKNVFTGVETRDYKRATTSQKCVRAGGKHNDLENVGYTARHHTFFEMLGNFSFGDYFKEEAIYFAWELITKNYGLAKDRLCVTVFHDDEDAKRIWKKVSGLSDDKIIPIATSDNFWMMGDTGPCGPCSEIFFDHGDHIFGGPPGSKDQDGDRFIEIWNLVFMQYEQIDKDTRIPLPKPSIDTGMGLERAASILQGKHNNYDIDLMRAIIDHVADLTGVSASGEQAASHKVIADHLRAASFLLADGVMPSNEGRGYVLRRIMRRGMRHAHLLGAKDPIMYKLFPTLQSMMAEAYPELNRAQSLISETLKNEESKFKTTLDRGLKLLDEETSSLSAGQKLDGAVAFKLYDTYGFPLDLTQDALRARDIVVDTDGFNAAMDKQKAEARKAWSGSGDTATERVWFDLLDQASATEFLGYDLNSSDAQIKAIIKDGAVVQSASAGDTVFILCNQTPFYAESGGQVGDTGVMISDQATADITDTQKKLGKLFAHKVTITKGKFAVADAVTLKVDAARRQNIKVHHSVTHLLHEALRQVLGDHVAQKGSQQLADRTRFDISHSIAIKPEELQKIEMMVNDEIRANTEVLTRIMSLDDARTSGARALFGEKYDSEVRVVSMGRPMENKGKNKIPFSVELCGGTHVKQTGDIGLFKIISESAVGSGVRRVEALAGETALAYFKAQGDALREAADILKTSPQDVVSRLQSILDEKKKLEHDIVNLRRKMATGGNEGDVTAKDVGGVKFIARVMDDVPAKDLKPMADDLKVKIGSGVIMLISTEGGKASIVIGVTDDLTNRFNAVELVKLGAVTLGGSGGGGRPDMAQAGGVNIEAANDAVSAVENKLAG